jgi:NAD(P)H-dependent FMN reductase
MAKNRLKVVGLVGSLAQHSTSLAALRIALEGAAEAGALTELLDVKELSLPMYDPANRNLRSRSSRCVTRSTKRTV